MTITTLIIDYDNQIAEPQDKYLMRLVADKWDLVPYKHGLPEKGKKQPPPDLIVFFHNMSLHNYHLLEDIKQKWGYIPFLLCVTGERKNIAAGIADWSISYLPQSSNNYYLPIFARSPTSMAMIYENQKNQEQHKDANKDAHKDTWARLKNIPPPSEYLPEYCQIIKEFRNIDKSRFCNFIYSNYNKSFSGTVKRVEFCQALMKYKNVDCAGGVMQNTDELKRLDKNIIYDKQSPRILHTILLYISKYKFTIAFENYSCPYYITEKIWRPFLVGSIPIYWGCPQIAQMFNPAAFINCHNYSSLDEVVSRVQEIDNDHELYLKYATAPPFLPDSLMYNFTPDKIQAELNQIMRKVVKHKELYRNSSSYSWLQKATEPQLLHHYVEMNRKKFRLKIKVWALQMKSFTKQILMALRIPERLWKT